MVVSWGNAKRWLEGFITNRQEDGTYDIKLEGGYEDEIKGIHFGKIRLYRENETSESFAPNDLVEVTLVGDQEKCDGVWYNAVVVSALDDLYEIDVFNKVENNQSKSEEESSGEEKINAFGQLEYVSFEEPPGTLCVVKKPDTLDSWLPEYRFHLDNNFVIVFTNIIHP